MRTLILGLFAAAGLALAGASVSSAAPVSGSVISGQKAETGSVFTDVRYRRHHCHRWSKWRRYC